MDSEQALPLLQAKLVEMEARLGSIKKDATQGHSGDFAEQAQERENDEVVDAIGNETRATIQLLNKAIERARAGAYGDCQVCGEPISEQRLKAILEAVTCINCS